MNTPMHCCFHRFVRWDQFKCRIKRRHVKAVLPFFAKPLLNIVCVVVNNSFKYHCSACIDFDFVRCASHPLHRTIKIILENYDTVWFKVYSHMVHQRRFKPHVKLLQIQSRPPVLSKITRCLPIKERIHRNMQILSVLADIFHAKMQLMTAKSCTAQKLMRTLYDLHALNHMLQNEFVQLHKHSQKLKPAIRTFRALGIHCLDISKTFESVDIEKEIASARRTKLHNNAIILWLAKPYFTDCLSKSVRALAVSSSAKKGAQQKPSHICAVPKSIKIRKLMTKLSEADTYLDLRFIDATSNMCKILFTFSGYVLIKCRLAMQSGNSEI